jgi:hypothetical protein
MITEEMGKDKECSSNFNHQSRMKKVCAMMIPTSGNAEQFLMQKFTLLMKHPPSSSELAPSNFFLFPIIRTLLKRAHFELSEVVFQQMLQMLKAISQDRFKKCLEMWQKRTAYCTAAKGNYFKEGNNNWQSFNLLQSNLCTFWIPPHTPHYCR